MPREGCNLWYIVHQQSGVNSLCMFLEQEVDIKENSHIDLGYKILLTCISIQKKMTNSGFNLIHHLDNH